MSCIAVAYMGIAYIVMAYIVMAYIVMASISMACIVIAYIVSICASPIRLHTRYCSIADSVPCACACAGFEVVAATTQVNEYSYGLYRSEPCRVWAM